MRIGLRPIRLALPIGLVSLGLLAHACNVYPTDLRESSYGQTPSSSSPFWAGTADNGCVSAGMPGRSHTPSAKNVDPGDIGTLLFGVDSIRLGGYVDNKPDSTAWTSLGFDLDGKCTASDTCDIELSDRDKPCMAAYTQGDGAECRDNNFGESSGKVQTAGGDYRLGEPGVNCAICNGQYNILFRVTGYNGQATDSQVRVDVYPSQGIENNPLPAAACKPEDWPGGTFCWRPTDPWKIRANTLASPAVAGSKELPPSTIFDDKAYVRDGWLVALLPDDSVMWFPHSRRDPVYTFPLRVHKSVVVGKLVRAKTGEWAIRNGVIGGRMPKDALVGGFEQLGVCPGDPFYEFMRSFADTTLDVPLDGVNDPTRACDAISVGVGFEARAASAGSAETFDALPGCSTQSDAGAPASPFDAGPTLDARINPRDGKGL